MLPTLYWWRSLKFFFFFSTLLTMKMKKSVRETRKKTRENHFIQQVVLCAWWLKRRKKMRKINGIFWHTLSATAVENWGGKKFITTFLSLLLLQQWCDELMKLAYNISQSNGSSTMFLRKAHVKLCLQVDKSGKIPIKKWVFFSHLTCFKFFFCVLWSKVKIGYYL